MNLYKLTHTNSKWNIMSILFLASIVLGGFSSCENKAQKPESDELYAGFQNPPADSRPFVRWWWNGNKIKSEELERELEVLKKVGFGGVEINPIAMPPAPGNDIESLVWMSDEWIDMVVHACKKAKDLGMITDIIAGTGWPFGGEFLLPSETCQRMVTYNIEYKGGATIDIDEQSLIDMYKKEANSGYQRHVSKRTTYKLAHISLVPENCSDADQIIDLQKNVHESGKLSFKINESGNYYLNVGLLQQNFRDVYLGAPGGAGPVMDHYKKEITYSYLSRMKRISERSGIPLNDLIRAIFCDSIEVSGANWTDGMAKLFYETYGYKIDNWLPFIFYSVNGEYSKDSYTDKFNVEFKDKVKRVRYDYNRLLTETFLSNFTQVYKDFCEENNILCRYQAYGTPFLMGMLDGYMIPDIPESNNWIYSATMKDSVFQWNQQHGYMTWNMYASAGGHLSGKKIISGETMTNLKGVFKTTLEEIKQHDDMNFITGINHSILHGFNYSPPDIKFPGWIRYGAYFSERNPWWEHLNKWVDYNARLSFIFQNSQADKSIAILGPTADLWGEKGLARAPFHMEPEYLYKLWEPISQLGYSCEYINQGILERAKIEDGLITYGNMKYKLLILASLKSISPEVASAIKTFAASGGKVVVVDQIPEKSLHFKNYSQNDELVKNTMEEALSGYRDAFINLKKPDSLDVLFSWTENMLNQAKIQADVIISNPTHNVYQVHQHTKHKDIYFFTNVHRYETSNFEVKFPVNGKYPWMWNPETGERIPYPYTANASELKISLKPIESLLLVFEDEKPNGDFWKLPEELNVLDELNSTWTVVGNRVDGKTYTWEMNDLTDFSKSEDSTQNSFAGKLIYKTKINNKSNATHIDLGDVNEGITELYINGKKIGTRWYGKAIYPITGYLREGENELEIHYTTVLANYCISLENNPMVSRWTDVYKEKVTIGLEGPVKLLK